MLDFFKAQTGKVLLGVGCTCFGLLVFGLYLQHAVGLGLVGHGWVLPDEGSLPVPGVSGTSRAS